MAAATVDTTASANKDGAFAIQRFLQSHNIQSGPFGQIVPIGDKVTVPSTSVDDTGDIIRLSPKFGPDTVLWDFAGTPSDMDSGANLVYDIVWVTEADVVTVTLVSGSTKAQAASGSDVIAAAAKGTLVGEGYLAMKVTTGAGAGATAGTYGYGMQLSRGWLKPAQIEVYLKDARA